MQWDNENLFEFYSLMRLQIFSPQKIHIHVVETIIGSSFSAPILEIFSWKQESPTQISIFDKPLPRGTFPLPLWMEESFVRNILKVIELIAPELCVCVGVLLCFCSLSPTCRKTIVKDVGF